MSKYSEFFKNDFIRCHNVEKADVRAQDGALRHAIGTHCFQVMRAGKHPDRATDGYGWSYNHAATLCFWNQHFFVDYLSDPESEHLPPSQTLITWSKDGANWCKPVVLFPPIEAPCAPYAGPGKEDLTGENVPCVMHQRMSFYVTSDNRLLATAFYGISPTYKIAPCKGYGVGRVVREIYQDFTFSDIYFLRRNEAGGYNAANADMFPLYTKSPDEGFRNACEELLANKLVTAQMWEEERLNTEWFTVPGGEALSYYTLPNGDIMGLYKKSFVTKSTDKGATWCDNQLCYSLETSTGKVWGQKTPDGRYALAYNPTTDSAHRWPLAVITGENGEDFDNLLAISPEVSPNKYAGFYKNLGPQYVRGICEDNPKPDDNALWLAYTVNKEDVWVSRTPCTIRGIENGCVDTDFNDMEKGSFVRDWNIYAPLWCPVSITETPVDTLDKPFTGNDAPDKNALSNNPIGNALCLKDADPYDRARAMRVFKEISVVTINTKVWLQPACAESRFTIELQNQNGLVPVRFYFKDNGEIIVKNGGLYTAFGNYCPGEWMDVKIEANCFTNIFTLTIIQDDITQTKEFRFSNSVYTVERILFTTKDTLPFNTIEDCGKWGDLGDLPKADVKLPESHYYIDSLNVITE